MIIATPLLRRPVPSVDVCLRDMPFDLDDLYSDATSIQLWVEGPYPCPPRSLIRASAPLSTFGPSNHNTLVVRPEGVGNLISWSSEYGPDSIFEGHNLCTRDSMSDALEAAWFMHGHPQKKW